MGNRRFSRVVFLIFRFCNPNSATHLSKKFALLIIVIAFRVGVFAQIPLVINDTLDQQFFIFSSIEYFEDPSGKITIDEVASGIHDHRFIPSRLYNPTNSNKRSPYWHRIRIRHNSASTKQWAIEFFDQTIDSIEFYTPLKEGGFRRQLYGDRLDFARRALYHKNFIVPVQNDTDDDLSYYFRVKSEQQADVIVVLRSRSWLFHYATDEYFFFGIFYGMILVFSFYNLLMYLAVRESHYLLYVLYLVSIGLYEMSADGIGYQYLWPNAPGWNQYAVGFAQYAASCLSLFFTVSILHLRESHRSLYKFAVTAFLLRTALLILSLTLFPSWFTFKPLEFIPLFAAFYIGLRCLAKGYRYARFIVVGYSFLTFGILTKVLLYFDFNWMPFGSLSHYSLGFSFIMEMIFLSFAISDKIRLLRIEKADAQERIIEQLKVNQDLKDTLNQELEEQVKIKTKELVDKSDHIAEQNHKLEEANLRLESQAREIAAMNALLARDNIQLKHDVAEVKEARILSRDVDFEEFSAMYPDDESCLKFLAEIKWLSDFACRKCGHTHFSAGRSPYSRRCSKCGYDESVTAYTLLQNTRLPINKAFYLIFLVYSSRGNISSHKLAEILSIRQSTCWAYSSKIKKAMKDRRKHGVSGSHEGWDSILLEETVENEE
jgi:two-component system, sensor histidine kinase LadS